MEHHEPWSTRRKLLPTKQKRRRYASLKPAKELMRQGKHYDAITLLRGHRKSLLGRIGRAEFAPNRHPLEVELALVNHQLSLAYEAVGNHKMADKRSQQAIKYYVGPNHLGFAMLIRDDGWRMLGRGKLEEAEPLIEQALRIIRTLRESGENVPQERIDMEDWVTQSYLGQVLIAKGEKAKGVALLRAADEFLKEGSKRYRELNNLMALIPYAGRVERRLLAVRAIMLNETHVHNPSTRLWLALVVAGGTPIAKLAEPYLR